MSRSSLPKRPEIHVTAGDYDRLAALADAAADAFPAVADFLADELDRAQIIEAAAAKGVVQMHSTVTYRDAETGEEHTVALVYPEEADITAGRLSVLTPVGVALIGLRKGQTITWITPSGKPRNLTVMRVEPAVRPAAA
jgi:regulator of nucleoside diphosphate kinase